MVFPIAMCPPRLDSQLGTWAGTYLDSGRLLIKLRYYIVLGHRATDGSPARRRFARLLTHELPHSVQLQ